MAALETPFRPSRSDCIDCSVAAGWHSLHTGQKLLSVHCCWALHRTRITQDALFRREHRLVTTGYESTYLQVCGS